MTGARAEIQRKGRWTWSIGIYDGEAKWGPVYHLALGASDFDAFGTRRMAERKARRLLRRYRTHQAREAERMTLTEEAT